MYTQRSNLFIINCFFFICLFPCFIFSLATNAQIKSGDVCIAQTDDFLNIHQGSDKAIIHWQDFSLAKEEKVQFVQPSSSSSILNKVIGSNPSEIYGKIDANGKVYLINQNGILFGKDAIINTKGFIASTLNIEDNKYLSGEELCFFQEKNSSLINEGQINAIDGNILLISPEIKNTGELLSDKGDVILLAGSEANYSENTKNMMGVRVKGKGSIDLKGTIKSVSSQIEAANGNIFTLAMKPSKIKDATLVEEKGGRIFLSTNEGDIHVSADVLATRENKGGKIEIYAENVYVKEQAKLDVSASLGEGQIIIGDPVKEGFLPKNIYVDKGALFHANALENGNGGTVNIWAEKVNSFYGTVHAKGGASQGNGGEVEISTMEDGLQFHGLVSTIAMNGKTGKLKLDPSDITIGDYGGTSSPVFPTTPPGTYNPGGSIATLDYLDVQNALATNNVSISTAGGSGGAGNINVEHGITWNAATTLELVANRNIDIKGITISNTHSGTGDWIAMDFKANPAAATTGNFSGIKISNATLSSNEGHIALLGKGGDTDYYNVGIYIDNNSNILSTGTGSNPANVTLNGTGGAGVSENQGIRISGTSLIQAIEGTVTLIGISNGLSVNNHGIFVRDGAIIQSTGTGSGTGSVIMNGIATGTQYNAGIYFSNGSTITSDSSNINITGTSNGTGQYNPGITMKYGSTVTSTGTGTSAALISLNGTSGTGTQQNQGVEIFTDSKISSIDGDMYIRAESRGTADYCHGCILNEYSEILSLGEQNDAATITIDGIAGIGSTDNFGVFLDETSRIFSERGDVTLNGGISM